VGLTILVTGATARFAVNNQPYIFFITLCHFGPPQPQPVCQVAETFMQQLQQWRTEQFSTCGASGSCSAEQVSIPRSEVPSYSNQSKNN
jgi:hypothetical protein